MNGEPINLGPCCACGQSRPDVRNIMMLPRRAPTLGAGWGCLVCNLPNDGALAVLCDTCEENQRLPIEVCAGKPAESHMRVPIDSLLPGLFEHDQAKHDADDAAQAENGRLVVLRVYEDEANELVKLVQPGMDPDNLPPLARVAVRILAAGVTPEGTCMVCGCTDAKACPEGCSWVNDSETLCSLCVPS